MPDCTALTYGTDEQRLSLVARSLHSSSIHSSPDSPTPSTSSPILASALLSRAPLVLPPLSPFARAYYAYQRRLARALAQPTEVSTSWFFKQGSTAETAFQKFDEGVMKRERGDEKEEEAFEMARDEVAGASQVVKRSQEGDNDLKSLERRKERTVYLVVKKQGAWVFPQGFVNPGESLVQAAEREVLSECGPDVDLWSVGQVPAGAFSPSAATPAKGAKAKAAPAAGGKTFFLPMRIVRGQVKPTAKGADFAWLTKEEVKDKVAADYWEAVEPILSDN